MPFRGVRLTAQGADVCLYAPDAAQAWACLFSGDEETSRIPLAKKGDCFEGHGLGLKPGDHYGFRLDGPWLPEKGFYFDPAKLLVDPYATRLSKPFIYDAALTTFGIDTGVLVPKAIVETPLAEITPNPTRKPGFIYELGVKSFTQLHPDVPEAKRGTMAALAEPAVLAHFKAIGVKTVELMPLHAWIDERHLAALGLHNAWGYNPVQFFAPDPRLCPGGWEDLRNTTAALHAAGLQVVVDVVYNHSGEADAAGPVLCFRGLANNTYYAQTNHVLHNDAGTGNTLALNHPEVTAMVLASLRHLVLYCGVDGFRFDLATALGRMEDGFNPQAPLIRAITEDPVLGTRILIAEPWDVGPGGYRVGNFPPHWLEWNDQFRDDTRRFWRGNFGSANAMATRLCGSSDIFTGRAPSCSVNFVAAHDGFTLRDLVHYAEKNNMANGEQNRDGNGAEVTWPGGDLRALLATLFLSRGTLMLTAGDEFGRTQNGNNNAYAQDNETTWLNWKTANKTLIAFVGQLAKLRQDLAPWLADAFVKPDEASWFGADGKPTVWLDPKLDFLGLLLLQGEKRLALVLNAKEQTISFPLPEAKNANWRRRFCSGDGTACAPLSVSVFEEVPATAQRKKR